MRNHIIVGLTILLILLLAAPVSGAELEGNYLNRWEYTPTEAELELVYQVVWLEAGNQKDEGQQAVAELILNRVYSDKFPNTIEEVLYQKGQFTCVKKLDKAKVTDKVIENVNKVFNGQTDVLSMKAFFYNNKPTGHPTEIKLQDHYFRREYK